MVSTLLAANRLRDEVTHLLRALELASRGLDILSAIALFENGHNSILNDLRLGVEPERIAQQRRLEHIRRLDQLEENPAVIRSILQDLQISMEIQPQWKQETEFLFQVNLQKPLGTTYLVDGLEHSCLLYVNNRPRVLLREEPCSDVRCVLGPDMGSLHPLFRIPPEIPAGSELAVEWINYNPRTKEIERLRTKPYIWSG